MVTPEVITELGALSTKVEPSKSRGGHTVTIEEVEDEYDTAIRNNNSVKSDHPLPRDESKPRRAVPVRNRQRFERDKGIPNVKSRSSPRIHSRTEPKRDRFGDLDPLGMNDQIWEAEKRVVDQLTAMSEFTEKDIPKLREQWIQSCQDIMNGAPSQLPPLREINHRIPIIDPEMVYHYHLPRCPESVKQALATKIDKYEKAGWWKRAVVTQAAPMLCVPKKNGQLRTVVDSRKRNENTLRDVTPFPDQDEIRADVARAKYRSKIDLSDAYEQIRVEPDDVHKTAFATVFGTFLSYVMQQGDCNAPSTFQRLMTWVFRDFIGKFVHVYLDDIFVFSNTIEEHQEHLRLVFERLREVQLYLKAEKCDLYSNRMECLGHWIDDEGIHADEDKMSRIRDWRTPRNYNDIERFLGLVNYVSPFMPDLSSFTGPLHTIQRNGHAFEWRPIHQSCFDNIKALAAKAPILKPIDPKSPDPIWVICDASLHGVGAVYGQGPDWKSCRPAGFMSKKFTTAQQSYRVFELETIAILEALLKWEDKLLGHKIHVVTDHKALEFFKTQNRMSHRQMRWMEFLQRFDFDITYVKGKENVVADCLSRYHESDLPGELHPLHRYVNADERLDPEGESLPFHRVHELRTMRVLMTQVNALREEPEERDKEAEELRKAQKGVDSEEESTGDDPTWAESMTNGKPLPNVVKPFMDVATEAVRGYSQDKLLSKVIQNPEQHKSFRLGNDGLLRTKGRNGKEVVCIPHVMVGRRFLTEVIIEQAHITLGHMSAQKTDEYIRQWFWWPRIGHEVRRYCDSCGSCQTSKSSTQRPRGLLHPMPIPSRPFGSIGMDFVGPFPPSSGHDYLWVVICRLTSMVHLIPIKTTTKASELAWLFIQHVVRLHGLPDSIVSDRDTKFTSRFWQEVHRILGIKLLMSTAFHPQTDGASERAIKTVGQVLRSTVSPNQRDWVKRLPMVEYALNSTKSSSTGFSPFELNGATPRIAFGSETATSVPGVTAFADQVRDNLMVAHDAIIESRVLQAHYANQRRRPEHEGEKDEENPYQTGKMVYLSTKNLKLPKGRAKKLLPKFVGPYKIIGGNTETSTFELELPQELKKRGIFPKFHSSLLRPFVDSDEQLFPHREPKRFYDFGMPDETVWLVDDIVGHQWNGEEVVFQVQWNLGETTWEPLEECQRLQAFRRYLELMDVARWQDLPRRGSDRSDTEPHGFREIEKPEKAKVTTKSATTQAVEDTPRRAQRVRRPSEKVREIEEGRGTT